MKCEKCKYWINKQRELEFIVDFGFCIQDTRLENENYDYKFKFFLENPFEKINHEYIDDSGVLKDCYCHLVTNKLFGCIFWEKK